MRIAPILRLVAAAALWSALLWSACVVGADELQTARAALRAGDMTKAAAAVDRHLAANPSDARGRFLKGVILNEQGKTVEAFDVFLALTQDQPELAEPYNNLAVLYAARGEYEQARVALEMSIRVNPAFATAYENLGDVYARLAAQAYEKALQHEAGNRSAAAKLVLARDLANRAPRGAAGSGATGSGATGSGATGSGATGSGVTGSGASPAATLTD